ncbi:tetratricopeptide repeat protein [Sorangium sp. So ce1389]|uniref:tetratricopeptide repeat protein n=1 Tax=Sorangium sp. So ce1389 TaxID=3133336 RepID=UPI003F643153
MSDPKRWIQDGGGAPQGARELLLAAARPRPMTSAELSRTAARVAPLGTAAGAGTTLPMWVKGLFVAVGLGLGGAGLHATLDGGPGGAASTEAPLVLTDLPLEQLLSRSRGGVPVAAPAQVAPAPEAAPVVEAPRPAAPTARRDAPRNTRPAAPAPAAPIDSDELLRESNLIDRARAAATQNPDAALSAVAEHQREFPAGRLAEEREYVAIRALMRLGRVDEARARADAFLARYPSTSYADRVHRTVGAAP